MVEILYVSGVSIQPSVRSGLYSAVFLINVILIL